MRIYRLKFSIPKPRRNLCLGNGLYVENNDELLVLESLGKNILLNHKRFITLTELTEVRSLPNGYYSLVKASSLPHVPDPDYVATFSSDRSLARKTRARRKKVDPT